MTDKHLSTDETGSPVGRRPHTPNRCDASLRDQQARRDRRSTGGTLMDHNEFETPDDSDGGIEWVGYLLIVALLAASFIGIGFALGRMFS